MPRRPLPSAAAIFVGLVFLLPNAAAKADGPGGYQAFRSHGEQAGALALLDFARDRPGVSVRLVCEPAAGRAGDFAATADRRGQVDDPEMNAARTRRRAAAEGGRAGSGRRGDAGRRGAAAGAGVLAYSVVAVAEGGRTTYLVLQNVNAGRTGRWEATHEGALFGSDAVVLAGELRYLPKRLTGPLATALDLAAAGSLYHGYHTGQISGRDAATRGAGLVGGSVGGWAGAMYGAEAGAWLGASLGPWGAVGGGVLGGVVGGLGGGWAVDAAATHTMGFGVDGADVLAGSTTNRLFLERHVNARGGAAVGAFGGMTAGAALGGYLGLAGGPFAWATVPGGMVLGGAIGLVTGGAVGGASGWAAGGVVSDHYRLRDAARERALFAYLKAHYAVN